MKMEMEMTLDEAILHCEEVANRCDNRECASEHRQLAEWLRELKERRASELPSAQPEIIHCRDCTYYQTRQKSNFLPMCCLMNVIRDADDFCSRAERRTDDT